jgi:hypothetical protein
MEPTEDDMAHKHVSRSGESGNPSLGGRGLSTDWHASEHHMKIATQDKSRELHGPSVNSNATRNEVSSIKVLGPRVA